MWLSDKESACQAGDAADMGSIPGSERSPGGGNGNPLQYSYLGNPMDREAWQATVHGVVNSRTRCSNSTTTKELKCVKEPVLDGVVKARPWCRGDIRPENWAKRCLKRSM